MNGILSSLSSPIVFVGAGYLALCMAGYAQDAVLRGTLVPGSIVSNGLALILMSIAFFGPVMGLFCGLRNIIGRKRLVESIVAVFCSIPFLLLWYAAASRSLSGILATEKQGQFLPSPISWLKAAQPSASHSPIEAPPSFH